jgi:hypothetical protein
VYSAVDGLSRVVPVVTFAGCALWAVHCIIHRGGPPSRCGPAELAMYDCTDDW